MMELVSSYILNSSFTDLMHRSPEHVSGAFTKYIFIFTYYL